LIANKKGALKAPLSLSRQAQDFRRLRIPSPSIRQRPMQSKQAPERKRIEPLVSPEISPELEFAFAAAFFVWRHRR
jgi:hypothetical protein